jgi:hypothetical protein
MVSKMMCQLFGTQARKAGKTVRSSKIQSTVFRAGKKKNTAASGKS